MAFRIIRASKALISFHLLSQVSIKKSSNILQNGIGYLEHQSPLINIHREKSFFNNNTAEELWKGATHVSNAGKKRGRGKSRRYIKNLNKGQLIGVGKVNMLWPGLNSPIMKGAEIIRHQKLPENPEREKSLNELRDSIVRKRKKKLQPLERGWSGGKLAGQSVGPPDPINDDTFEGFDSKILNFKIASIITGNLGRRKRISTMIITGNRNGLVGFATGKGSDARPVIRLAKNRAGARLMYINRYKEHTVFHDFYSQFGKSKIFVFKRGEGHGLICHRVIKTCCELIGIKDLYAKVEGSPNIQHIVKAFLIGLLQQKTHEQLAEEKRLHLVEFKEENGNFPLVVASPREVRKPEEIKSDEVLDFTQYVMGGKVVYEKKKPRPFYEKMPSWTLRLRKTAYLRNKDEVRLRMYAEHGQLQSFYTDKYPEAKPQLWKKEKSITEDEC